MFPLEERLFHRVGATLAVVPSPVLSGWVDCGSPYAGRIDHSLFRMILPEMVLGSSSRNSTILGYL